MRQDIDAITVSALYEHLVSSGRKKRDTNHAMFDVWGEVTSRGQTISARELAEKIGVHRTAATKAMQRYRSGRVPTNPSGGLSRKTVHSVRIMLRSALSDAVTWKYIATNPAKGVKGPSIERRGHRTWTPEQLHCFLTHVKSDRLYAM